MRQHQYVIKYNDGPFVSKFPNICIIVHCRRPLAGEPREESSAPLYPKATGLPGADSSARTLAMRCLPETPFIHLNPDDLPEMNQALTAIIDHLVTETIELGNLLLSLPALITNLQHYQNYCTARQMRKHVTPPITFK